MTNRKEHKPFGILLLLLDSFPTFRECLSQSMQQSNCLEVVCQAGTAREAEDDYDLNDLAIAVIDMDLLDESGIGLCKRWVAARPDLRIVLLSNNDRDVNLAAGHAAGAVGFLLRTAPTQNLVRSIRLATARKIYTSEQLKRVQEWEENTGVRLRAFRPREWQVLWCVASGMRNSEIAADMTLAENTVEKYITSILQKLGLSSRSSLLAYIHTHHLDVLKRLSDFDNPFATYSTTSSSFANNLPIKRS